MTYSTLKYQKFSSQRRFGVELEMSNALTKPKVKSLLKKLSDRGSFVTRYQLSGDNSSWHIKEDATCGPLGREGPKGVEIASYVAKGLVDLNHIADTADGLSKGGCVVNNNCGFHIHAEALDLTSEKVGKLLAYWIKLENVLSLSLPERRRNNFYCKNISRNIDFSNFKFEITPRLMWGILRPMNLNFYENEDRRFNLNLVNFARALDYNSEHRKTLELRWPEGTLSGKDIRGWVVIFLNFIDICKNLPMPQNLNSFSLEEALVCLGLSHDKDFLILSETLHETKTWFLERILQNNQLNKENKKTLKSATNILNIMWSPIKKYA